MTLTTYPDPIELLPHRYPFLLIDKVVQVDEKFIVAVKNITHNEPCFVGHFPERKIFPGVLIIEAMAQSGGFLLKYNSELTGKMFALSSVDSAKFRKLVRPGDSMAIKSELLVKRSIAATFACKAFVNDILVAEAKISMMLASM